MYTVATEGVGNSGSILVSAPDRLQLSDQSRITSGSGFTATGLGGNVDIQGGTLQLNNALIAAASDSSAAAGSVSLNADYVNLFNGTIVSVSSLGGGDAGNLAVSANQITLKDGSQLQAELAAGEQGNILLTANQSVLMRRRGAISTNATGTATGGDIKIDAPIIIGLENSDITANALQGNGGNINITTQGIFGLEFRNELTPENDITASSEFGISGTVEINNLTVDSALALVELSSVPADADDQIAAACASDSGNQFIASGRGGLPVSPVNELSSNRLWNDIRNVSFADLGETDVIATRGTSASINPDSSPNLAEASGWQLDPDGNVELLVTLQPTTNSSTLSPDCLIQASTR